MTNVVDEVLNTGATDNKVKYILTHENGTTETVQIDLFTPVVTQGTPLNKALFDSIQTDLTNLSNNKLNVSEKATQVEAETGTNDTKYMTPLKVKQEVATQKIVYSRIAKWTESTKTLNFADYIASNTVKLEIIIDNVYEATYTTMQFAGTNISTAIGTYRSGSSTYKIGEANYIGKATLKIEVFPLEQRVFIIGDIKKRASASGGTETSAQVNEQIGYDTLTSLKLGKLDDSTNPVYNADYPIVINQYTK